MKQTIRTFCSFFLGAFLLASCAMIEKDPNAITKTPDLQSKTVKIWAVADGFANRVLDDGYKYVINAPLSEVEAALREEGLRDDEVTHPYTPLLLEKDGRRMLIDTGYGDVTQMPTMGKLLENLRQMGASPDSITDILITHFHGDHINGLKTNAGKVVFPKARVHVPQEEWDYWMSAANKAKAQTDVVKANFSNVERIFQNANQEGGLVVIPFITNKELLNGIIAVSTFGHSPGHTSYAIILDDQHKFFALGDMITVDSLFLKHPSWSVRFDRNPEQAVMTRLAHLPLLADRADIFVSGFHFSGSAIGHIVKEMGEWQDRYRFVPLTAPVALP